MRVLCHFLVWSVKFFVIFSGTGTLSKKDIEPNHAAGVKLIFLILTVASAGILFYYVTAALKMSKIKPYG